MYLQVSNCLSHNSSCAWMTAASVPPTENQGPQDVFHVLLRGSAIALVIESDAAHALLRISPLKGAVSGHQAHRDSGRRLWRTVLYSESSMRCSAETGFRGSFRAGLSEVALQGGGPPSAGPGPSPPPSAARFCGLLTAPRHFFFQASARWVSSDIHHS